MTHPTPEQDPAPGARPLLVTYYAGVAAARAQLAGGAR